MTIALELKQVSKSYGKVQAVQPLDLTINQGELVTLLGPSGCGKTTLLRLIAGLERVTTGVIEMKGEDVTALSAGDRNVSMVFQSYALFPHMNVAENVSFGLISMGKSKEEARVQAAKTLDTVGLNGFGARLPSQLSGGQQQRVALARALVLQPDILLFDEPLSNLDARLRRKMREEIRELQQSLRLTGVYVTHDQAEAMAVSDQIIVMRNAMIAQKGTPRELYENPKTVFVASFMGEANSVKGILNQDGSISCGNLTLDIPHEGLKVGEIDLSIRPEAIHFADAGIEGVITTATYMGQHYEYNIATTLGSLFMMSKIAHNKGDKIYLNLDKIGVNAVQP